MPHYYYFAATLPALQLGAPAPMTSDEFLERCSRHLGEKDHALVAAALLVSPAVGPPTSTGTSRLLRCYYAWERTVRNELARLRARRLERAAEPWIRQTTVDDTAPRAAQAAFQASHPLEAELILERQRWDYIQGLRALHAFDLESIAAYRLELQILERLARLRHELGETRYRQTYAAILGAAQSTDSGVKR